MGIVVLAAFAAALPAAASAAAPKIKVLSNRADLISGGDALVEIRAPKGTKPARLTIKLNGKPARKRFAKRENGRFQGIVRGLRNGRNVLSARAPGGPVARVKIINHPNGGPVFSGPQVQPWECQDGAVDAKCNQPAEFTFLYRPAGGSGLEPYNVANPPDDVAMTTTDDGNTVPFIVRLETGYQDRDQYKIATLYRPGEPWKPWAPQDVWNRKLVITHGFGCGVSYGAGEAPSVDDSLGQTALARGFAVGSTALDNNSHNCNIAVQAESLVMLKEHLVETRGPIRYTIASGCSGGSVVQQQVANAYPGDLPGADAAVLLPGHVLARDPIRRLPHAEALLRGPLALGAGRELAADAVGGGRRARLPHQRDHGGRGPVQECDQPPARLSRDDRREPVQPGDQPGWRPLRRALLHDQRPRPASARGVDAARAADRPRLRRGAIRQRRRAVRARGAPGRVDLDAAVRRPERQDRRALDE